MTIPDAVGSESGPTEHRGTDSAPLPASAAATTGSAADAASAAAPVPTTGRGAWPASGRGGTLALDGTPGGYYLYRAGSAIVGSGGLAAADLDHRAVAYGVKAIQFALRWHGSTVIADARYGPATATAVAAFQKTVSAQPYVDTVHPADPAGVVGKGTAFHLFAPMANAYAQRAGVPVGVAHGIVELESAWDPGAVGGTTPQDLGLAQWRTPLEHDGELVDEAKAFDPFTALRLLAQTQAAFYASLKHWGLTIAAHHAPAWAQELATSAGAWAPDSAQGKSWSYLNVVLNHVS
jgi:peptidoglycan hydrolase-like protein with peptidoglycan-binding domain